MTETELALPLADLFGLRGRTALVTGGSRGIGHMIARGLLSAGAEVFICARKEPEVRQAAQALSAIGRCIPLVVDLAHAEGPVALHAALLERTDRLDILINNAGASWGASLAEFPRARFEQVLNLNLTVPFELVRLLLPLMKLAGRPERPARIVNIASIDGLRVPAWPSYPYGVSWSNDFGHRDKATTAPTEPTS